MVLATTSTAALRLYCSICTLIFLTASSRLHSLSRDVEEDQVVSPRGRDSLMLRVAKGLDRDDIFEVK